MWPQTPKDMIDHLIAEYSTSLVCVNRCHYLFGLNRGLLTKQTQSRKGRCGGGF